MISASAAIDLHASCRHIDCDNHSPNYALSILYCAPILIETIDKTHLISKSIVAIYKWNIAQYETMSVNMKMLSNKSTPPPNKRKHILWFSLRNMSSSAFLHIYSAGNEFVMIIDSKVDYLSWEISKGSPSRIWSVGSERYSTKLVFWVDFLRRFNDFDV